MKKFHESLKKNADAVRLTDAERAHMRAAFLAHMRENPTPVPTPYPFSFVSSFSLSLRSGVAFALAVLVVGAGGTAYAAEGALPGDALYAVKVGVNEPVAGALAVTPAAKGAWHAQVAETRLAEAETLVSQGRLTASTSIELAADFTEHASQVDEIAASLQSSDPSASAALSHAFSATLLRRGGAILHAGEAASSSDKYAGARLVRAAVGTQSSELALNAVPASAHAPAMAQMMRVAKQAPSVSSANDSADADADDHEDDERAAPQPQAKVMMAFSATLAAPVATDTDASDTREQGTGAGQAQMAPMMAAFAPARDDTDKDSSDTDTDEALARAIERATGVLDDARDDLDASTTAAFDAQLSDLRLAPLAVAADAAAGDDDAVSSDRAQGVRSANALSAAIRAAALRAHRGRAYDSDDNSGSDSTISAPAQDSGQP